MKIRPHLTSRRPSHGVWKVYLRADLIYYADSFKEAAELASFIWKTQ